MVSMEKLTPEQASRALGLMIGLQPHRFFYKASGFTDAGIEKRLERWQPPRPRVTSGVLVDWHLLATQFDEGAMVRRKL